jgi:tetratricopeptide (TPR) repeat protein
MKYLRALHRVIIPVMILYVATSCAPSARVPVMRPAEIYLQGINRIAVVNIEGNIGREVADSLTTKLFEANYFEIIDRERINRIMREHNLTLSSAVDERTAAEMGRRIGAAALIFGDAVAHYEQTTSVSKTYKKKDGSLYRFYHKDGIAKVKTNFRVVDLRTGKIVVAKSIVEEATVRDWERNRWPPDLDREMIVGKAANKCVDAFMGIIAPHIEYVHVSFADSQVPESKAGVDFAQKGLWSEALKQFRLAVQKGPNDADAWYNLGIGYEYNHMYPEAIEALKKSYRIKAEYRCLREITNCYALQAERRRLKQQGAVD